MATILLSAGDASGEAHAAELVRALRVRMPETRFVGLGGTEMAAAGVELVADQRALAIGGFVEIATSVRRIVRAWRAMMRALREMKPDLVVLIDSGGFNLPLARQIRARSDAQVLYYIAPQVWAWRAGRLHKLAARTDRIAVLFPFERDFYLDRGVEADLVGHPILDTRVAKPLAFDTRVRARSTLGIEAKSPLLGILPGSRRNEVVRHLPLQLAAFARLRDREPALADLEAIIGLAPSLDPDWIRALARETGVPGPIRFEPGGQRLLDAIDVAVAKPGKVTAELMLRERPMVVIGRAHPLTAWAARRAVEMPWLSLPNLILGEAIVPELLQGDATPDRIAGALAPLFGRESVESRSSGPPREPSLGGASSSLAGRKQIEAFRRARARLGEPGATTRVVGLVEEMLGTARS